MSIRRAQDERIEGTPDGLNAITEISDVPDAPTIGTATAGVESASVTFTAAATGGAATSYGAISTPGSITGTSATSPITVSGLTADTSYTFKTYGINAGGTWSNILSAASNSITALGTSFVSIATATPSATNTITFSSISNTYKSLQIRFIVNNTAADSLNLRFNGDTGTNYAQHQLEGNGTLASSGGNATGAITGIYIVSLNDLTYQFSAGIIDIIDYASTTKYKTVRIFSGRDKNGSGGKVNLNSGLWLNTAAVTSITLYVPSNYETGSTFALYGIKG